MKLPQSPLPQRSSRLGLHYFQDSLHYRESDLTTWLPELMALGISWLVVQSSVERAIPEFFLRGLLKAGIEPIIQFNFKPANAPAPAQVRSLFEAYAHWGAKAIYMFDKPNRKDVWASSSWMQQDLPERFLDRYIPLANQALDMGLIPVFPALEPGGAYWDTAFLRSCLQSLLKRDQQRVIQSLVLGVYGWTHHHNLTWGAGGPERHPTAKAYQKSTGSEDQLGFRIFDWYQAIAQAVLQQAVPVILLQAGQPEDPFHPTASQTPEEKTTVTLQVARLMAGEKVYDSENGAILFSPVQNSVLAANFWLLSDDPKGPFSSSTWYQSPNGTLPLVSAIKAWRGANQTSPQVADVSPAPKTANPPLPKCHPICHYLLLPNPASTTKGFSLDGLRSFIQLYMPTIGYSLQDATLAARVSVAATPDQIPDEILEPLRMSGSAVVRINRDGTFFAQ